MSILIKNMEMPKDGDVLMVRKDDDGKTYIKVSHTWGYSAELIELPPHGDLIDYNFCLKNYELLYNDDGNLVYAVRMRDISAAPVIIEAEEVSE